MGTSRNPAKKAAARPAAKKAPAKKAAPPPPDRDYDDPDEAAEDEASAARANAQRAEAAGRMVTFEWDGEEWSFNPANSLTFEYLAGLEDYETGDDPTGIVRAFRVLLGKEQADRLFRGRMAVSHVIADFFRAAGKAGAGEGNR